MDLVSPEPQCNLYDARWPIRTYQEQVPPAKTITRPRQGKGKGAGATVTNSIISGGCVLDGAAIARSVLSPNVHAAPLSLVEDSVLLDGAHVGRGARIRKAVIDHDVFIPDDCSVGFDLEEDKKRFTISPGGVVAVPRGIRLD